MNKRIVHDADVLEIMRPCCGHGGREFFREKSLRFLGTKDERAVRNDKIREQLIEEAWYFIRETEVRKDKLKDPKDYMSELTLILKKKKRKMKFLYSYIRMSI